LENSDAFAVAAERPEPKGLIALPPTLPRLLADVAAESIDPATPAAGPCKVAKPLRTLANAAASILGSIGCISFSRNSAIFSFFL
jgi:hypothetical protein